MNRIEKLFKERDDEKVMSLFITAGYPDLSSTVELILEMEKAGADMIELGMPFSDPLADGPTIQYASEKAIQNGVTISKIMDMVKEVRQESSIPIILMGYMNPVLKYGVSKFCKDASESGVDGLILPDIPADEDSLIRDEAEKHDLDLIYLVAPNSSNARMRLIDDKSSGFVYCVSVTGVTGAREKDEVQKSVDAFIDRVNENVTRNPVLVGFGIKNHEDAMSISAKTDGFIVGSALIEVIKNHYPESNWQLEVHKFVKELKYS